MAMNGTVLGTAIKNAMDGLSEADKNEREKIMQTMCDEIISHIIANAVVTVTSVSGVTAGGASSGPGTGTITA